MSNTTNRPFTEVSQAASTLSPFIRLFTEIGRGDLAVVGGKGANLGELVRAGFPVPPGFVVTTHAYDQLVRENHLDRVITLALSSQQDDGASIREAFEQAALPAELKQACLAAYRQLGQGPVAVRSSATAEDLPGAAFAGQQETVLNVVSEEALLGAVRHCFASLWTDRVLAYRERQGIDQQHVQLAVVVQRMVQAEAAGVLFTANPITGARDEMSIDANPGLGEAVVSGLVTPDHAVMRRRYGRWRVETRQPGKREVVVRSLKGGGTEQIEADAKLPVAFSVSDCVLSHLAHLGAETERHFGCPQDIEWAWDGSKLWLLQARPMTALPEPLPRASKQQQTMAHLIAEMMPIRPYPLDVTTWSGALFGAALGLLGLMGIKQPSLEQLYVEEEGVVVRLKVPSFGVTPRLLLAPVRLLAQAWRFNPLHWQRDPVFVKKQAQVRTLETLDVRSLSWSELLTTVREEMAFPVLLGNVRTRYFPRALLAFALLWLWLKLLWQGKRFGVLLSGVETKTIESNRALEVLAEEIRSQPPLARLFATTPPTAVLAALETQPGCQPFLAHLRAFLDRYGHRESMALLVTQPTWKDAPEVVLGLLKELAVTPPQVAERRPAWEVARDELLAHPLVKFQPTRVLFLKLLATARCLPQIREDSHFYGTLPLPVIRRTLLECGRRLVECGALALPEEVFHLTFGELGQIGEPWPPSPSVVAELQALVASRKARRDALAETPLLDPRLFQRTGQHEDALLVGAAGSPGVAEGPVRVIHNASEFGNLQSGDVLVAPYTNPAWTPLFQRAVAVIVDSGSAGSHAAIVAREYHIPAVMGTIEGTKRLSDGQRVRVDGTQGLIFSTSPEREP